MIAEKKATKKSPLYQEFKFLKQYPI